jgi:hypothetical protein
MKEAGLFSSEKERQPANLLVGAVFAACLALVFGVCLMTALDALRPPASKPDGARATALEVYKLKQAL